MKKATVICAILLVVLIGLFAIFSGCSSQKGTEEVISENQSVQESQQTLTISYLGEDTVISMGEIMQLETVERKVMPVPREGEEKTERSVKGVILDDVFQKFIGAAQADLFAIRFVAGDGYAIEVAKDLLQSREIILAYEIDGKPLEDYEKPFRSIVPEVFEMYWVKNLVKIEVVEERQQAQVSRIILMETRINGIPDQEYAYDDSKDRAVKIADLLFDFGDENISDTVYMLSIDGLEKNEKLTLFKDALIKYTGEDVPVFTAEDIPRGMWVRRMLYFRYCNSEYFSARSGFKTLTVSDVDGKSVIKLTDVFSRCGIADSEKYIFKAVDNYSVEIEKDSIDSGYIYTGDDGLPAVFFEGLPKNTSIKDLVYIGIPN